MLSLNNMLNTNEYKRPAKLSINSLLNSNHQQPLPQEKSPSLSPSLTSSPASVSSTYSSYPFPPPQQQWDEKLNNYQDIYSRSRSQSIKSETEDDEDEDEDEDSEAVKAKRRRANAKQLEVLNRVFDRTFFPSTQMRAELGRQLGMSPRTVQIWFQNRRQAMRTRERQRLIRLRNNKSTG